MHPGVEMFRIQPVADGPAGSDKRCCPVGTDGRHAVHDEDRPTAGGPVGRFPNPDPLKASKTSSLDEQYQPLAAGSLDANGMYTVDDSGRPMAGGPLGRLFSLDPMGPRGMSTLGDENQPPSVGSLDKPWMTERLDDRAGEPDYKRTTQIRSESERVTGVRDPVIQTGSEVQTDRVNISTDNGLTNSRETSPSSDSGVHSWTEQWENMSENSTYSSLCHTDGSHREDSGRVSQLEFRAPPNTEDEDDSDYPDTDGLLAKKLGGCPSEGMYGKNGRIPYSAVTGGGSERNADIAALSDFSDDSSELGVRQRLECRTPVPVQPILPTGDYAPILRTPPVKARGWAEELLLEEGSTSSTWSRWDYGTLPEMTDPAFTHCIESMMQERLARDADPRLDRYYPKLVQSLANARRMSGDMWDDHGTRLMKQGTVCIAPGCQCRMREDMMLRIFNEEMERVDSVSARFPDRHVRKYVIRNKESMSEEIRDGRGGLFQL